MNPYTESIRPAWENPNFHLKPYNHIIVNWNNVGKLAATFAAQELELPDWRAPVFVQEDDENFLRFIFVVNSLNYCFTDFNTHGKFDTEYRGTVWEGAFAMIACLKRALDNGVPILNPRFLSDITPEEAENIFSYKSTPIPMMESRFRQLQLLGQDMERHGFFDFADVFKSADYYVWRDNGDSILGILENFESYRDFRTYEEQGKRKNKLHTLKFQKRAQLLPMMYYGRAMSSGGKLQIIRDPESVGPVSDYELPKALECSGVDAFVYSEELRQHVDEAKEIKENSIVEVSIRSKTVEVMKELVARTNLLRPSDKRITMAEIDYPVWRMGRKSERRHHYTYTTSY